MYSPAALSTFIFLALSQSSFAQRRNPCDRIGCGPGYCVENYGTAFCVCPRGYRFDRRITTCVPDSTPPCFPSCGIAECGLEEQYECPNGFKLDICGCTDPQCYCEGCPLFNKSLNCPNGFMVDSNGCPISQCVSTPPPPPPPPTPCPSCPVVDCGLFYFMGQTIYSCPNGYRVDSCGCTDQSCNCAGCPDIPNIECPYGFRTRRGCPAEKCVERPYQDPVRCPRRGEPGGTPGPFCSSSTQCTPPLICCADERGAATCITGIPDQ
ncbi:antistasin-like [Watersipora subatra]|uniref:antistasin-like n=1 Tax=Watersipora subatra TaxID=2589382 RepID=UPI00355C4030